MNMPHHLKARRAWRQQRGVSMIFAMISLVVLTLGGVALVRSVDTGALTLGNLGFRKDAVSAASYGTEEAIKWMFGVGPAKLEKDAPELGYYAVAVDNLAPTLTEQDAAKALSMVDWSGNGCGGMEESATAVCIQPTKADKTVGSTKVKVKWVITRLCAEPGPGGSGRPCALPIKFSKAVSMDKGMLSYMGDIPPKTTTTFYRVITRAEGSRQTVAITETLVHF
ncbi:hypothetical protein H5407_06555 [Mitsuaria sp. WAJ17]|uniref:pilus assembly PilX family protein n=1 Tax=Mitsuaria sp. WAJ17 TaxID=2761452 RepID=UPI001603499C|nr:hypothetical protein [Mitsuaria sp. WAJ17]MBB2484886.1 hypothetical protein [Mitsuaria sp. WAJ17]